MPQGWPRMWSKIVMWELFVQCSLLIAFYHFMYRRSVPIITAMLNTSRPYLDFPFPLWGLSFHTFLCCYLSRWIWNPLNISVYKLLDVLEWCSGIMVPWCRSGLEFLPWCVDFSFDVVPIAPISNILISNTIGYFLQEETLLLTSIPNQSIDSQSPVSGIPLASFRQMQHVPSMQTRIPDSLRSLLPHFLENTHRMTQSSSSGMHQRDTLR